MQTKFTLVLAALLCAAVTTKAQVSKGNTILGGNFSFTNTHYGSGSNVNATYFSIAPSVGKVYKDNKVAGITLRYQYNGNQIPELRTSSYGAGIFLRQYKSLGKGFYIFLQESLNANFDRYKYYTSFDTTSVIRDNKNLNLSIAINPGLAYDLSKRIQLELLFLNNLISAGYTHTTESYEIGNNDIKSKQTSFYASSNNDITQFTAINVGVKIFFGR